MVSLATLTTRPEVERVTPPDFRGAKQPQIAISQEGKIFVAFGKENEIYLTTSDDAGGSFATPWKIAEVEKLALGMRRGPRIAIAGNRVAVTAISHADGNLYAWVSADGGRAWSRALPINSVTNSAREGLHAMATDGKGKLMAVWLDLRNGKTELWSSASNDGGRRWEDNRRVYKSPDLTICECCHPSVVFRPGGEVVVMWRNSLNGARDMYQAASTDGGRTFSDGKKIGTGTWRLPGCPMDGGSVAATGEEIRYAWRREGKLFVSSEPNEESLLAEEGIQPVVVPRKSDFSYVWQKGNNLYWKPSVTGETELLARNAAYVSTTWSEHHDRTVLVWEGSDGIFFRTFDGLVPR